MGAPDEQQPVCVPCEAEAEEGGTAMEVGGQGCSPEVAEAAAELEGIDGEVSLPRK